jgi:hypothetical protein
MEDTNMKKTYINPEIAVVKIATHQMLATSGPAIFDELGGGQINLDPATELDPSAGDEVLSRELDDFDDEEEDF